MILGLLRNTTYNIVLFLHILTVIVAMAGAVGHPLLFALEEKRPDGDVVARCCTGSGEPRVCCTLNGWICVVISGPAPAIDARLQPQPISPNCAALLRPSAPAYLRTNAHSLLPSGSRT